MRRLFSTFARGAPGAGLLLMRLAAGGALLVHAAAVLKVGHSAPCAPLDLLGGVTGALLLLGLWTPVVAALAAAGSIAHAFITPSNAAFCALLAAVGIALMLLGPGGWSLDARLFGWRRLDIPARNRAGAPVRSEQGNTQPPIEP